MTEIFGKFIDTWETGASAWSFADLQRERPGVTLGITAVNVTRGDLALFSAQTTPTVRLLDALRASTAIPLFFTPWRDGAGDIWCDGALVEQYPWSVVKDKNHALVVVCSEGTINPKKAVHCDLGDLTDYIERLFSIGRRRYQLDGCIDQPRYWIATNNHSVSTLDFELNKEGRVGLFEEGRVAARRWLAFRDVAAAPGRSRCVDIRQPAAPSEIAESPPQSADPDTAGRDLDAGNRMLGSRPLHTGDAPCPFRRPDTGAQRRDRRWSL